MTRVVISASMTRRILIGCVVVAQAGGAIAIAAVSQKSPTIRLGSRAVANGAVTAANSRAGAAILTARNLVPGGSSTGTLTIHNTGDQLAALTLTASRPVDVPGPGGGLLSSAIQLYVTDITGGSDAGVYTGALGSMRQVQLVNLRPGEARAYRFSIVLPDTGLRDGPDGFQGSSTRTGYTWTLTGALDRACASRLRGTARANRLIGTGSGDQINGRAGNDRIIGRGGNDCLYGGSGADQIFARDGRRDVVDCGSGRDRVYADRVDRLRGCEIVHR
jgi:Ca2+-binding RTX toxin-like protein